MTMNISLNNTYGIFQSSTVKRSVNSSCSFSKLTTQPTDDCFIRSTNLIKKITNKQRLQNLYNRTYDDTLRLITRVNPVVSELKLQKPEFRIEKFDDPQKGGGYGFADNCITIAEDMFDYCSYIIGTTDEIGKIDSFIGFASENNKNEKIKEARNSTPNATLIKLTEEEKDIYVQSAIVHELRHFVQNHLIASTKNCGEIQKAGFDGFLKTVKDELAKVKEEYIQACKEAGITPDPEIIKEDTQYYETYTPKKLLLENTTLKFSCFSDDNRRLSVKNHLLKSQIDATQGKGIKSYDDDYHSSALEIDAYNFQYEYLLFTAVTNKNVRKDVITALSLYPCMNRDDGLEIMNKRGINFV